VMKKETAEQQKKDSAAASRAKKESGHPRLRAWGKASTAPLLQGKRSRLEGRKHNPPPTPRAESARLEPVIGGIRTGLGERREKKERKKRSLRPNVEKEPLPYLTNKRGKENVRRQIATAHGRGGEKCS